MDLELDSQDQIVVCSSYTTKDYSWDPIIARYIQWINVRDITRKKKAFPAQQLWRSMGTKIKVAYSCYFIAQNTEGVHANIFSSMQPVSNERMVAAQTNCLQCTSKGFIVDIARSLMAGATTSPQKNLPNQLNL